MRFAGLTRIRCVLVAAGLLTAVRVYMAVNPPEPEVCALCESINMTYYAPALVNLHTGEIDEMYVYQRDPQNHACLASEQRTGFMRSGRCAGAEYYLEGRDFSRVFLSNGNGPMDKGRYCYNCRRLLTPVQYDGYALVDVHEPDNIRAFTIKGGAEYEINGYTVSVYDYNEAGSLAVQVTGHLLDADGKIIENRKNAVALSRLLEYTDASLPRNKRRY